MDQRTESIAQAGRIRNWNHHNGQVLLKIPKQLMLLIIGIVLFTTACNSPNQGNSLASYKVNTVNTGSVFDLSSILDLRESPAEWVSFPAPKSAESLSTMLNAMNLELPKGHTLLDAASGDLDGDGISEKVLVINTDTETTLGSMRQLQIYKVKYGSWHLWHQSERAVLASENGGMMGDPFVSIQIENASLVINHVGGNRDKWRYSHRFQLRNRSWRLVNTEVDLANLCQNGEHWIYDLVSGKITLVEEQYACYDDKPVKVTSKNVWERFRRFDELPSLESFHPGKNTLEFPDWSKQLKF